MEPFFSRSLSIYRGRIPPVPFHYLELRLRFTSTPVRFDFDPFLVTFKISVRLWSCCIGLGSAPLSQTLLFQVVVSADQPQSFIFFFHSKFTGKYLFDPSRHVHGYSCLSAVRDPCEMDGVRGEIVQVRGGQVVRSTGRKDRHNKVYTAKGIRDRRVRLSAHTAIQFYDVQDRLGYDRPSKAVDWLIRNAKQAIDKLSGLPSWHPNGSIAAASDDNNSDGAVYMMEMGTSADSQGLTNLATSGFVSDVSDSVMDVISVKDLGSSLHSFQVQKQLEQIAPFASSTGTLAIGSAAGDDCSRSPTNWSNDTCSENPNEFSFNQLPPQQSTVGIGAGGCNFQQRGTLQSSLSTSIFQHSFSFAGRFASEGSPGFCFPGHVYNEDEFANNFGLERPPSSSTYCLSSCHSLNRT